MRAPTTRLLPTQGQQPTRRQFLRAAWATSCGLLAARASVARAAVRYEGLATDRYLGPVKVETTVEDAEVFTEGPAFSPDGLLYFTNTKASKILRWDPRARTLAVFREQTNEANGLLFDARGRLLCCEGNAGRVTRIDIATGKVEVLADQWNGQRFSKPNDLCLDRQGRIYFSARTGAKDEPDETPKGVYRIDPNGQVTPVLQSPAIQMPNGLDLSPDEKTLYVIESHPEADRHRDIRAFDVKADGTVTNERVVVTFYPGRSGDGLAIDMAGNLVVAAGLHKTRETSETLDTRPGIHVISPEGKLLAFRETPEDTITNCTFGGEDRRTLYVTCGTKILSIRAEIPGKP